MNRPRPTNTPIPSSYADLLKNDRFLLTKPGQQIFLEMLADGKKRGEISPDQYNQLVQAQQSRVREIMETPLVDARTGGVAYKQFQPRGAAAPETVFQTGKDLFVGGSLRPDVLSSDVINARQAAIKEGEALQAAESERIKGILQILAPKPTDVSGTLRLGKERIEGAIKGFQTGMGMQGVPGFARPTPEQIAETMLQPDLAEIGPDEATKAIEQEGATFGQSLSSTIAPMIGGSVLNRTVQPIAALANVGKSRYAIPITAGIAAATSYLGSLGGEALREKRMRSLYGDKVYEEQIQPILGEAAAQSPGAAFAGNLASVPLQGGLNLASGIGSRAYFGTLRNTIAGRPTTIIGRASDLGTGAKRLQDAVNAGEVLTNTVNSPSKFHDFTSAFLQKIGQASKEGIDSYTTFKPTGSIGQRLGQFASLDRRMPGFAEYTSDLVGEQFANLGFAAADYTIAWNKFKSGEAERPPSISDALVNLALGSVFIKDTGFQRAIGDMSAAVGRGALAVGKQIPGLRSGITGLEERYKQGNIGFIAAMQQQEFEDIAKGVVPAPAGGVRVRMGGMATAADIQAKGLTANEIPISIGSGRVVAYNPDTQTGRVMNYGDIYPVGSSIDTAQFGSSLAQQIQDLPIERIGRGTLGKLPVFGGQDVVKGEGESRQQIVGVSGRHVIVRENPVLQDGTSSVNPEYSILRVADLEQNNQAVASQMFEALGIDPDINPYNFDPANPRTGAPSLYDIASEQADILDMFGRKGKDNRETYKSITDHFRTKVWVSDNMQLRGRVVGIAPNKDAIVQLLGYETSLIRVNPVNLERGSITNPGDVVDLREIVNESQLSEAKRKYLRDFDSVVDNPSSPYAEQSIDKRNLAVLLTNQQTVNANALRPALQQAIANIDPALPAETRDGLIEEFRRNFIKSVVGKSLKKTDTQWELGSTLTAVLPTGEETGVVVDNTSVGPVVAFGSNNWEGVVVQPDSIIRGTASTPSAQTTIQPEAKGKAAPGKRKERERAPKPAKEPKAAKEPRVKPQPQQPVPGTAQPTSTPAVATTEPEITPDIPEEVEGDYADLRQKFSNHVMNEMNNDQRLAINGLVDNIEVVIRSADESSDEGDLSITKVPLFYKGKNLYHSAVTKIVTGKGGRLSAAEKNVLVALRVPEYARGANKDWWRGQYQIIQFLTNPQLRRLIQRIFADMSDPSAIDLDIPNAFIDPEEGAPEPESPLPAPTLETPVIPIEEFEEATGIPLAPEPAKAAEEEVFTEDEIEEIQADEPKGLSTAYDVESRLKFFIPYGKQRFTFEDIPWSSTTGAGTFTGSSKVIDGSNRKIVVANINGVRVPFYLSTGRGGKRDVPSGKWYPFFGLASDGWINKTGGADMRGYYGSDVLKAVAEHLDSIVGDVRDIKDIQRVALSSSRGTPLPHVQFINQDMIPTENETPTTLVDFRRNLEQLLGKLDVALGNNKRFSASDIALGYPVFGLTVEDLVDAVKSKQDKLFDAYTARIAVSPIASQESDPVKQFRFILNNNLLEMTSRNLFKAVDVADLTGHQIYPWVLAGLEEPSELDQAALNLIDSADPIVAALIEANHPLMLAAKNMQDDANDIDDSNDNNSTSVDGINDARVDENDTPDTNQSIINPDNAVIDNVFDFDDVYLNKDLVRMNTDRMFLDPARFQFRAQYSAGGASGSTTGAEAWNEDLAGIISVWRDPKDNKVYVVNGHNRFALAKRLGVTELNVRFLNAKDADEALLKGAIINIGENNATPIDVAVIFKRMPDARKQIRAMGLSSRSNLVTLGIPLSNLPESILTAAHNDANDMQKLRMYAAIGGNGELDHDKMLMIWVKVKTNPDSGPATFKPNVTLEGIEERVAEFAVSEIKRNTEGVLIGFEDFAPMASNADLFIEFRAAIKRYLKKETQVLAAALRKQNAEILARAGNQLNQEQTEQIRNSNQDILAVWQQIGMYDKDFRTFLEGMLTNVSDNAPTSTLDSLVEKNGEQIKDELLAARGRFINNATAPAAGSMFDEEVTEPSIEEAVTPIAEVDSERITTIKKNLEKVKSDYFENPISMLLDAKNKAAIIGNPSDVINYLDEEFSDSSLLEKFQDEFASLDYDFNELQNPEDIRELNQTVLEQVVLDTLADTDFEFIKDYKLQNQVDSDFRSDNLKFENAQDKHDALVRKYGNDDKYKQRIESSQKTLEDLARSLDIEQRRDINADFKSSNTASLYNAAKNNAIKLLASRYIDRVDGVIQDLVDNYEPDEVTPPSVDEVTPPSVEEVTPPSNPEYSISEQEFEDIKGRVEDYIQQWKEDPVSIYIGTKGYPVGDASSIVENIFAYIGQDDLIRKIKVGFNPNSMGMPDFVLHLEDIIQGILNSGDAEFKLDYRPTEYSFYDPAFSLHSRDYVFNGEWIKNGEPISREDNNRLKLNERVFLAYDLSKAVDSAKEKAKSAIAAELLKQLPSLPASVGVSGSDPYTAFKTTKEGVIKNLGFDKITDSEIAQSIISVSFPWGRIQDGSYKNELKGMSRKEIRNLIRGAVESEITNPTKSIIDEEDISGKEVAFGLLLDDLVEDLFNTFVNGIDVLSSRSDLQPSPTEDEGQMGLFQMLMATARRPKSTLNLNDPRLDLSDADKKLLSDSGFVSNGQVDLAGVGLLASQEGDVVTGEITVTDMPNNTLFNNAFGEANEFNISQTLGGKQIEIQAYRITSKKSLQINIRRLLGVTAEGQQMSRDQLDRAAEKISDYMNMLAHGVVSRRMRAMVDAGMLNTFGRRYEGGAQIPSTRSEKDFISYDEFAARDLLPLYTKFKKLFNEKYGKPTGRLSASQIFGSTQEDIVKARTAALAQLAEAETVEFLAQRFPAIGHISQAAEVQVGGFVTKGFLMKTVDRNTGRAVRIISAFYGSNIETVLHEIAHGWLDGLPYYAASEMASAMGKTLRLPTPTNPSFIPFEMHEEFAYGLMLSFSNMDLSKGAASLGWVGTTSGVQIERDNPIAKQLASCAKFVRDLYSRIATPNLFNNPSGISKDEKTGRFFGEWRVAYQTRSPKTGELVPNSRLYLWKGAPVFYFDKDINEYGYAQVVEDFGTTSDPTKLVSVVKDVQATGFPGILSNKVEQIPAGAIQFIGGKIDGVRPTVQHLMTKWLAENRGMLGLEGSATEVRDSNLVRDPALVDEVLRREFGPNYNPNGRAVKERAAELRNIGADIVGVVDREVRSVMYTPKQKIKILTQNFDLPLLKSAAIKDLAESTEISQAEWNKLWVNRTNYARRFTKDPIAFLQSQDGRILWKVMKVAVEQRLDQRLKQNANDRRRPGIAQKAADTLANKNSRAYQNLRTRSLKALLANIHSKYSVYTHIRRSHNPPTLGWQTGFELLKSATGQVIYDRRRKVYGLYNKENGESYFINTNDGSVVERPPVGPKQTLLGVLSSLSDGWLDDVPEAQMSSMWSEDSLDFDIPSIVLEDDGKQIEFGNSTLRSINKSLYTSLENTGVVYNPVLPNSFYVQHPYSHIVDALIASRPYEFTPLSKDKFYEAEPLANTTSEPIAEDAVDRLSNIDDDDIDESLTPERLHLVRGQDDPEINRIGDYGVDLNDSPFNQFSRDRFIDETQRSVIVTPDVVADVAQRGVDGVLQSARRSLIEGDLDSYQRKVEWANVKAFDTMETFFGPHNAIISGSFNPSVVNGDAKAHFAGTVNIEKASNLSALARAAKIGRDLGQPNVFITRPVNRLGYGLKDDGSIVVPAIDINLSDQANEYLVRDLVDSNPQLLNGVEMHDDGKKLRVFMVPAGNIGRAESTEWENAATNAIEQFFSNKEVNQEAASINRIRVQLWSLGSSEYGGVGAFTEYERVLDIVQNLSVDEALPSKPQEVEANSKRLIATLNQAMTTLLGKPISISERTKFRRMHASVPVKQEIALHWEEQPVDAYDLDPHVKIAYQSLIKQLGRQAKSFDIDFDFMPIRENQNGKPDTNYIGGSVFADMYSGQQAAAIKDLRENRHLFIKPTTADSFGANVKGMDKHPLWQVSNIKTASGEPMRWIDVLNGIQQAIQVSLHDANFNAEGESLGYVAHSMLMEDPWAIWALANETVMVDRFATANTDRLGLNGEINFDTGVTSNFSLHKMSLPPLEDILCGCNMVDDVLRGFTKTLNADFDNYNGTISYLSKKDPKKYATTARGSGNAYESIDGNILGINSPGMRTAKVDMKFQTIETDFENTDSDVLALYNILPNRKPNASQIRSALASSSPAIQLNLNRPINGSKLLRTAAAMFNEVFKAGAAGDASPVLMQNYILSVDNPAAIGKQMRMLRRTISNPNLGFEFRGNVYLKDQMNGRKDFDRALNEVVRSRPTYNYAKHLGLTLAAVNAERDLEKLQETNPRATMMDVNELGESIDQDIKLKWMQHLPGHGQSQRFYSLSKDATKMTAFDAFARHLVDIGYNPTPLFERDDMGEIVLDAEGRPKIFKSNWNNALRDVAALMNVASGDVRFSNNDERDRLLNEIFGIGMYSPRWWASRLMMDRVGRSMFRMIGNAAGYATGRQGWGDKVLQMNRLSPTQLMRRDKNVGKYHWKLGIQSWSVLAAIFALLYGLQPLNPDTMEVSLDKDGTRLRVGDYTFRAPGAITTQLEMLNGVREGFLNYQARRVTEGDSVPLFFGSMWQRITPSLLSKSSPLVGSAIEVVTGRDAFGQPAFIPDDALKMWGDETLRPVLQGMGIKGFETPEINLALTKRFMWWWIHDIMDNYKAQRDANVDKAEALMSANLMGAFSYLGGRVLYNPKEFRDLWKAQQRMEGASILGLFTGKSTGMDLLTGKIEIGGDEWDAPIPESDRDFYLRRPIDPLIGAAPDSIDAWY